MKIRESAFRQEEMDCDLCNKTGRILKEGNIKQTQCPRCRGTGSKTIQVPREDFDYTALYGSFDLFLDSGERFSLCQREVGRDKHGKPVYALEVIGDNMVVMPQAANHVYLRTDSGASDAFRHTPTRHPHK